MYDPDHFPDGDRPAVVVLSDSHRETDAGLRGRAATAVAGADRVLHAGDFTTERALAAHREAAERLDAVHGNRDRAGVTDTLPAERTLTLGPVTVALRHRHRAGETGLVTWGRASGADLVVSGHTHRHAVSERGPVVLLNPGSHADPRGGLATHAELVVGPAGLAGAVRTRDGAVVTRVRVPTEDGTDGETDEDGDERR